MIIGFGKFLNVRTQPTPTFSHILGLDWSIKLNLQVWFLKRLRLLTDAFLKCFTNSNKLLWGCVSVCFSNSTSLSSSLTFASLPWFWKVCFILLWTAPCVTLVLTLNHSRLLSLFIWKTYLSESMWYNRNEFRFVLYFWQCRFTTRTWFEWIFTLKVCRWIKRQKHLALHYRQRDIACVFSLIFKPCWNFTAASVPKWRLSLNDLQLHFFKIHTCTHMLDICPPHPHPYLLNLIVWQHFPSCHQTLWLQFNPISPCFIKIMCNVGRKSG